MESRHDDSTSEGAVDQGRKRAYRKRLADGAASGRSRLETDDANSRNAAGTCRPDVDETGESAWVRA